MNGYQIGVPYLSPIVKRLVIINLAIWFLGVMLLQKWILHDPVLFRWFGLIPLQAFQSMWIWQFFTYMFLHSDNVFHLVFNMLLLWWLGSELEGYWGRRFFTIYYLGCGIGAAILYTIVIFGYYLASQNYAPLTYPVVGASGSIFGLMLAYGMIYGERIVYFFFVFPMKAKYFVMILAGIEIMNLMSQGFGNEVSNLSHLGGLVSGYLILKLYPRIREWILRRQTSARGRRLKLVVDNDRPGSKKDPKYWN